jgi:hypothetical protein
MKACRNRESFVMNFSCNRRSSVSLASLELNLQNICSLYGSLVLYIDFNN